MTKIILVDGMSILFRSFYGINMWNSKKLHIGGVYGFLKQILKLVKIYKSPYIVIALDTKQETWRHKIQSSYKGNRRPTPPDLIHQFAMVRDLCRMLGLKTYEGSGYEADDWLASCAEAYRAHGQVYIVSTDKDFLQLVSDRVTIFNPFSGVEIDPKGVEDKLGIRADQVVDFLALTGDEVDSVVGVRGIGPKTAAKWLNEYGNIDNIILNIQNLTPLSKRKMFMAVTVEHVHQARTLITLYRSLKVDLISDIAMKPVITDLHRFLRCHEIDVAIDPSLGHGT